jgi:hypothetical protein
LALGGLLGDERLRVYRDGRIEGALMLPVAGHVAATVKFQIQPDHFGIFEVPG